MREPHWLAGMTRRRVTGGLELMVPLATSAVRSWRETQEEKGEKSGERADRRERERAKPHRKRSDGRGQGGRGELNHWRVLTSAIRIERPLNSNQAHLKHLEVNVLNAGNQKPAQLCYDTMNYVNISLIISITSKPKSRPHTSILI